jgi:hypothetical protein
VRYTITHLSRRLCVPTAAAIAILTLFVVSTDAQVASTQGSDEPFAKGRWHVEFVTQVGLEAWNYNTSHEELYGLIQGVTYGLRDGLTLNVRQRLYYVSQRLNDSRILGITSGLRIRLYRRGRTTGFLQFDLGISDSPIAIPQRGTRFNYMGLGGGGFLIALTPRLHMIATMEVIHVSNAGLAGPDRNPDIEAIGPSLGLVIGFN